MQDCSASMRYLFTSDIIVVSVLITDTSLSVHPPAGWYVDDYNRHLPIGFQCSSRGGEPVTWMFKGRNLASRCSSRENRTVCGSLLLISKFRDEYAGLYTCRSLLLGNEVHVKLGGRSVSLLMISIFLLLFWALSSPAQVR
jgi:hypothetical protein